MGIRFLTQGGLLFIIIIAALGGHNCFKTIYLY